MHRVKYSLSLILSIFLLSSIFTAAQNHVINELYDNKNRVSAKLLPLVGNPPSTGYMPFRLVLKNGSKLNKKWDLSFTSTSEDYSSRYYYRRGSENPTLSSDFSYNCPPESTKTYDILVPLITAIASDYNDSVSAQLNIEMVHNGQRSYADLDTSQSFNIPSTLLSTKLYVTHSSKFNSLVPSSSRGYSSGLRRYTTEFTPSALPSDWRGYSGFDAIVCTDEDWLEMSIEARGAVLEWNRLGGKLYIYRLNPASNFKSLDIDDSAGDKNRGTVNRSFGSVTITPLSDIASLDVSKADKLIRNSKTDLIKIAEINEDYNSTAPRQAWSLLSALGKLSFSPVYLILILVIFGILVGPVNLFVFAKSRQRHRLFITTPIIAIGASLVLVLLIIIQDGFGGHGQRVQLVEVRADGGENKSYVWQEQAARTGVVLSGSFETSSPALMAPVPVYQSRFSRVTRENAGGACNYIAETGDKGIKASGDWFQSRSVHGHYLESVIPTRGRINLKNNQDTPVLNSSFDFKIDSLIYVDDTNQVWLASDIAAGDSIGLSTSNSAEIVKLIHDRSDLMSTKLKAKIEQLRKRKNHFIALTTSAPAIDTLDSIKWTQTTSIITGPVIK